MVWQAISKNQKDEVNNSRIYSGPSPTEQDAAGGSPELKPSLKEYTARSNFPT